MANCDYFKATSCQTKIDNCPACFYWNGQRCRIESKVLRNDKTDLIHEDIPHYGRNRVIR